MHYLHKLLTFSHQICSIGAFHMNAPTDIFTSGLTYFCSSLVSKFKKKSNFGLARIAQIVTAAETSNLAYTDLLMSPYSALKTISVQPTLLKKPKNHP